MTRMSPRAAFACVLPLFATCLAAPFAASAQPAAPAEIGTLVLQPGPEGKDACAWLTYPADNFGAAQYFYSVGLPDRGRAFLQFDLSGLPAGATVTSAQIELWAEFRDGTLTFEPVASDWDEATLTWNNQPGVVSPALAVTYPISRGAPSGPCYWGCFLPFDVTPIVSAWAGGTIVNRGFRVVGNTPGIGWMMASSDCTSYPRPRLSITYDTDVPVAPVTWGRLKAMYR